MPLFSFAWGSRTKTPDTYSKIHTTLKAYLDGYREAFSTKDAIKLSKTLTPDCVRSMQPKAFANLLGLTHNPITVADYEAIAVNELPALEVKRVDIVKLIIDPEKKTACVKTDLHCLMKSGAKENLEFVFMLDFTDSCDQVKAVIQFADTQKISVIVEQIKALVAGQNKLEDGKA